MSIIRTLKSLDKAKALKVFGKHAGVAALTAGYIALIGCPFRRFLGIPCPGCGMARAHIALFEGHLREAFAYHPLFIIAVPLLFFFIHVNVFHFPVSKKAQTGIAAAAIVLFIGVYLVRVFVLHDPVLRFDFKDSVLGRIL